MRKVCEIVDRTSVYWYRCAQLKEIELDVYIIDSRYKRYKNTSDNISYVVNTHKKIDMIPNIFVRCISRGVILA